MVSALGFLEGASLVGAIVQQITGGVSRFIDAATRNKIKELAKDILDKSRQNQNTYNKLINALETKNSNLLSALYQGMGFGPRMESIRKEIQDILNTKNEATKEFTDKQTQLDKYSSDLNRVESMMNSGSVVAAVQGLNAANQLNDDYKQNIQGGLTNEKKVQ